MLDTLLIATCGMSKVGSGYHRVGYQELISLRAVFYEDGTNPTLEQVRQFIDISEETIKQGGVVAVHCKAGLGRTGTLIGAYMIYKWGFTASEAIAFQRFMRPGCVVGPQQHYLYANQHTWVKWAAMDSVKRSATPPQEPVTTTQAEASSKAAPTNSRSATPPPQTEGHPNAPVPGQPRKTPGAKSRHGIALPETNDEGETEAIMVASTSKAAAQDDEDSNMECVDTQRQQDAIDSQDDSGMEVDEEPLSTTSSRPPPPAQPKSSTRPPSRIAKSKSPLTTNLDNRQASMHTSRPASSSAHTVPRSKGARNLGLLSDHNKASLPSASTRHTGSSANGPSDRYNLRQASRSGADAPTSPKATSTAPPPNAGGKRTAVRSTRPTAPQPAAQSPSKLPTATGSKRKGATSPSQPAGRTLSNPKGDLFTDSSSTNGNKKTRLRTRPVRTTNMDRSVRAAA